MATSGTYTSGRYGHSSYGPWLTLAWTQVSQSVANNTTTLDLTLKFHWDQDVNYIVNNKKGSVQGNSYTYSGSFSGVSGSKTLKTQRVTIAHNSNGSKSVSLSGNITSLGLYWYSGGTTIGTMSVSGTAKLETIPRASTLSAFSFNANLKNGTANQIKYTIDRKSDAFRHHIELRDGNTVVRTWDNQSSDGESTLPLTATEVNTLLNRMSTSTTKSYTLRVATRSSSGGSWIGSAVSRNATATVDGDVKPTVSAVTLSQTGNPVSTHTLQGFSKIKASFTGSAGYGASISSSDILVRRKTTNNDVQWITGLSGTTAKAVSLSGTYQVEGRITDSRGRRSYTPWAEITVTPYSAPTITSFGAVRNGSTPTTVNISRATTHTVLGTSNHLTYTIQRRQGTGAWTNVNTGATGTVTTSGATGSATSTGNSVTQSYDFRIVVTDKLGGSAEALQSVSTQRVVLDIHKNEGVGIGKIHEQGVLDVDGDAYFKGRIIADRTAVYYNSNDNMNFNDITTEWALAIGTSGGAPENRSFWYVNTIQYNPDNMMQVAYGYEDPEMYTRYSRNGTWSAWERQVGLRAWGTTSTGFWKKFSDGLMIAWITDSFTRGQSDKIIVFPTAFYDSPGVSLVAASGEYANIQDGNLLGVGTSPTQVRIMNHTSYTTWRGKGDIPIKILAVGRWKA